MPRAANYGQAVCHCLASPQRPIVAPAVDSTRIPIPAFPLKGKEWLDRRQRDRGAACRKPWLLLIAQAGFVARYGRPEYNRHRM